MPNPLLLLCLCLTFSMCFGYYDLSCDPDFHHNATDAMIDTSPEGAVSRFIEYVKIKSVQPEPDYFNAVAFLKEQAARLGLPSRVYEFVSGKPVFIAEWQGSSPSSKSIVLNSHMDVVPVDLTMWKHSAFEGEVSGEPKNIYGRGTQDMKSVGIQYLEAIGALKKMGFKPQRTVFVLFVPDEEIGGKDGMVQLVNSGLLKTKAEAQASKIDKLYSDEEYMNVGLLLDEGLPSAKKQFNFYYGERAPWWFEITTTGPAGHGSMLLQNTAADKLDRILHKVTEFRKQQIAKLEKGEAKLGDLLSINMNYVNGGHTKDGGETFQFNVIPNQIKCGFDMRVPPTITTAEVQKLLDDLTSEEGVSISFNQRSENNPKTDLDTNKFWPVFKKACDRMDVELELGIFPAATDSRFVRAAGIDCFGFSPINETPMLLHDHDEFLPQEVYLRGISIYADIISALTSVP